MILTLLIFIAVPIFADDFQDIDSNSEIKRAMYIARNRGVDVDFIEKIRKSGESQFISRLVRINVTNYAEPPDYRSHYNKKSVKAVRVFMRENRKLLISAQKKTNVKKEVIASILWIESRCGQITGTYNAASVFLSLLLAPDSVYVKQSIERVMEGQKLDSAQIDSVKGLIMRRAMKKSEWAVGELRALSEIDKRGVINAATIRGSWAGAFGYPQFLPSSFQRWAVDGDGDGDIDLYSLADAVFSVGNYLKSNGWGKKRSMQRKAVHHYNNSNAYVNAVFTLARKVR